MLTIAMSVSVTFFGLTFMWAQGLITPNHILGNVYKMGYALASAWGAILFVIVFIHIIRLLFWIKRRNNNNNNNDNNNVSARIDPLNCPFVYNCSTRTQNDNVMQ